MIGELAVKTNAVWPPQTYRDSLVAELFSCENNLWRVKREGSALAVAKALTIRNHETFVLRQSIMFLRTVNVAFKHLHVEILRGLSRFAKAEMSFDMFFNQSAIEGFLIERLHQVYIDILLESGTRAYRQMGQMQGSFTLLNERARNWLREKELKFASQVSDTTISGLRETLEEGYAAGENYKDLSARVSEVFAGTERETGWKAMRIARTEINSVSNHGLLEGFMDMGVSRKEWLSASDARPWHLDASGQVVNIDQPFIVMGEELMAPGDDNGSPENVINCRCVVRPVIF